jgi:hypothetical protein
VFYFRSLAAYSMPPYYIVSIVQQYLPLPRLVNGRLVSESSSYTISNAGRLVFILLY